MIPVNLTLRNFMSYGEERTTLRFTGMHVACLSGDNGNGKSALLDAMTYALWGKTRASGSQASSEDDLIRLNAEEMEVQFEFLLQDDLYRVIRKRNRRTRTGDWQVYLRDSDGSWRSVSGNGVRETGRQLARILHMEYETFLNSAYIQQGRADEFTRQKPEARKRILADILNLSRYDRLEEMAREKKNECDLVLKDLEGEIRHLGARLADEETYRARLAQQQAELEKWTAERADREERLNMLRAQQAALEEKAHRLREHEDRLREKEQEAAEWQAQITRLRDRIEKEEALIAAKPQILADMQRLRELRAEMEQLEEQTRALHEAQLARAEAQKALEAARQKLLRELDRTENEWRNVEERRKRIALLETRLADLQPKLAYLEKAGQDQARVRAQLQEAHQSFTDLAARNRQIRSEIEEIDEVLSVLAQPRAVCPVCQSDLSGGRQAAVVARQEQRKRALLERLEEVKRQGSALKRQQEELQKQSEALEEQLRGAAALRAQGIEWQNTLRELQEQNAHADTLAQRLAELRRRVEAEDYGAKERARLQELERQIIERQRDAQRFQEMQAAVRALMAQDVDRRFAQLEEAERVHTQNRADVARLEERYAKRCAQIEGERNRLAGMRAQLGDIGAVRQAVEEAEGALREAVDACNAARDAVTRTQAQLEECARARETQARKQAEYERVEKDRRAYHELMAAFGKKGVQALIIDNALPEIQDEANHLLARMTDNAMQISLSTLRTGRTTSSPIETLDISITDDAGTRPYEMFSGGEAFRINFALRIALSRLLARRAGARLQTLIIDEGFGTQDARGRDRLVEAIEAVKDEFALILVISHIEALKDAFPTRIEITKTPDGSQIHYLE